jgi:hypothetical protein
MQHVNCSRPCARQDRNGGEVVDAWRDWQAGVIDILRTDFGGVLPEVREEDVDWEAWRQFFDEGRSPRSAVDRAFLRDL